VVAAGYATLKARVDDGARIAESNESNNLYQTAAAYSYPPISIVYPDNNMLVSRPLDDAVPINVLIGATLFDPNTPVTRVEFYYGSTLIGSASTPVSSGKYEVTWSNVDDLSDGTYVLTAKAYNSQGVFATSRGRNFILAAKPNQPPMIAFPQTWPPYLPTFSNGSQSALKNLTFTVTASDPDGSIAKVDFYNGFKFIGSTTTSIGNNQYRFTWNDVQPGTYTVYAVAYDNVGASTGTGYATNSNSSCTNIDMGNFGLGTLPDGWRTSNIGALTDIGIYGYGNYSGSSFTVRGAGQASSAAADAFEYTYTPLIGDGEFVARIASAQNLASGSKIGVMIRASLDADTQFAALVLSGSSLSMQYRLAKGGSRYSNSISGNYTVPIWMKISRNGSQLSVSSSSDGSNWTLHSTQTITMPEKILCGLSVTNNSKSAYATVTYSNVGLNVATPTCDGQHNGCITRNVVILCYDPAFKTKGNKRLHEIYNQIDPYSLTVGMHDAISEASNNHVKFEIKRYPFIPEYIDEVAGFKSNGRRIDESSYDYYYRNNMGYITLDAVFDMIGELKKYKVDSLINIGEIDDVVIMKGVGVQTNEVSMIGPTAYYVNGAVIYGQLPVNATINAITYDRDAGTNFDGYIHGFEDHMDRVFRSRNADPYNSAHYGNKGTIQHLWDAFISVAGTAPDNIAGVGCSHFSPNATSMADNYCAFQKTNSFYTRGDDWLMNYPNLTGTATYYSNASQVWGCDNSTLTWENGYRFNFYKWMFARIPNKPGRYVDATNPTNNGKLNNWWEYIYNFNKYPESR
jgi:hypothetical protein